MAPPGTESKTLRDLCEEDFDRATDYKSDTDFVELNGSPLTSIKGEDDTSRAPNPFPERVAADKLTALRSSVAAHQCFGYYCGHEFASGRGRKLVRSHHYWWEASELAVRP